MRRLLDLVLIVVLLGGVGAGAYWIGHRVDHLSNQVAAKDPELNGTGKTAAAVGHAHTVAGTHITPFLVVAAILTVLLALAAAALINTIVKTRKRERWRLSS